MIVYKDKYKRIISPVSVIALVVQFENHSAYCRPVSLSRTLLVINAPVVLL